MVVLLRFENSWMCEGKMKKNFLVLTVVFLCFAMILPTVFASSESDLEAQKDAAQQAKEEAQYQVDQTQDTIDGIKTELANADAAIDTLESEIDTLNQQIDDTKVQIEDLEADLAEAEDKKTEQEAAMEERARVMYMYGNEGYAEVLFSSENFADLISKIEMVQNIMQADKDMAAQLKAIVDEIGEKQTAIEAKQADLQTQQDGATAKLDEQQDIKAQEDELLAKNQELIDEYAAEVKAQDEEMQAIDSQIAALATPTQTQSSSSTSSSSSSSSSNVVTNSSGLIWPLPSAYYPDEWDDFYGDRIHPIYGYKKWHDGVDCAAPTGTSVWAPANGVVTYAGGDPNYGYGYHILVETAYGTALYGHLSAIYVSVGQSVSQGETIGAVGSTGASTGPHLHFGLYINGASVDPWDYVRP